MPPPLYLCVHVPDFAAQALMRRNPELHSRAAVVLSGDAPLERVFAMNQRARQLGLTTGMSRMQAESFAVAVLRRNRQQEDASFAELSDCAQRFSPRIESIDSPREESCGATLLLDISGSGRLLGDARQIAESARHSADAMGYEANVVTAHNAYTAVLAARGMEGAMAIAPGREAEVLAPLPLAVLELDEALAQTFATWGIHTLRQLATLPAKALVARVGQSGLHLQAQARGEYSHLLVPTEEPADAMISESIELDHPVELLEPLLFLLSQMLKQVTERAARRALAIAWVEICMVVEGNELEGNPVSGASLAGTRQQMPLRPRVLAGTRQRLSDDPVGYAATDAAPAAGAWPLRPQALGEHRRRIRPALPERDPHTLLKLIQLDLELHPPQRAVIALRIEVHPARPQIAQQGLFAAQAPESGRLEILLARLRKLVGEGRVGAPELIDSHAPEAFKVADFEIAGTEGLSMGKWQPMPLRMRRSAESSTDPVLALRMVRPPVAIGIELHGKTPAAMYYEGQRVELQAGSGPWRSSGTWWTHPGWCREEWDVVLQEAPQRCLRLAYDPGGGELTNGGSSDASQAATDQGYATIDAAPAAGAGWYVIGIYD